MNRIGIDILLFVSTFVHYVSLLVISSVFSHEIMFRYAVSSAVIQTREKKWNDIRFYRLDCDVPLCNPNCLKEYHKLLRRLSDVQSLTKEGCH